MVENATGFTQMLLDGRPHPRTNTLVGGPDVSGAYVCNENNKDAGAPVGRKTLQRERQALP